MDCTRQLVKWCKLFRVGPGRISFEGYTKEFPRDIGGRCYYWFEDGIRMASIKIPDKLDGHCQLMRIALWHEFCHAELFVKTGRVGHCKHWYLLMLRKPHMFICQILLVAFWNRI